MPPEPPGLPARDVLPLVYDAIKKRAERALAAQPPGQSLNPTGLVHEAYLRLHALDPTGGWTERAFVAAAAKAIQHIVIDHARRRKAAKHGGGRARVPLDAAAPAAPPGPTPDDLIDLDAAIARLAATHPAHADLVRLKFFAGLTVPEIAAHLDVSPATAERRWAFARAWLLAALDGRPRESGNP